MILRGRGWVELDIPQINIAITRTDANPRSGTIETPVEEVVEVEVEVEAMVEVEVLGAVVVVVVAYCAQLFTLSAGSRPFIYQREGRGGKRAEKGNGTRREGREGRKESRYQKHSSHPWH